MSTRPRADNSPGQWGPDERLHALRLCPLFRYWPETRLVAVAAIARARSYARGPDVAAHRRDVIVVAPGGLEIRRSEARFGGERRCPYVSHPGGGVTVNKKKQTHR